jgi:hypothetical protein
VGYKDGGAMAAELDYVPLPAPLIAQVKATWAARSRRAAKRFGRQNSLVKVLCGPAAGVASTPAAFD